MQERLIQKVALGTLIFTAALVGNRGMVNQENSPSSNLYPPTALDQFRDVIVKIGNYVIPENLGGRSYPSADRFD